MQKHIPDAFYYQILDNVPIACVDIAILSQGTALLVKRTDPPAKGEWWVPGGRVLKGETMRETALRKARDEVGIECYVGPIIHTAETIFPDGGYDIPVHSINSCFLLSPTSPNFSVTLDNHHEEYMWVSNIPEGLHPYVESCLAGAGLTKKPKE